MRITRGDNIRKQTLPGTRLHMKSHFRKEEFVVVLIKSSISLTHFMVDSILVPLSQWCRVPAVKQYEHRQFLNYLLFVSVINHSRQSDPTHFSNNKVKEHRLPSAFKLLHVRLLLTSINQIKLLNINLHLMGDL